MSLSLIGQDKRGCYQRPGNRRQRKQGRERRRMGEGEKGWRCRRGIDRKRGEGEGDRSECHGYVSEKGRRMRR